MDDMGGNVSNGEAVEKMDSMTLVDLAVKHGTDKWGAHFYVTHYQSHFERFRYQKINFLEIGVGGYDNPRAGGESLRMWKEYFPNANIYAIDIFDKSPHEEGRIKIFKGSQADEEFLKRVISEIGGVDIIVDDGSHLNEHIIKTFNILFPLLNDDGVYAVEDIQTAYWRSYGGDSFNLSNKKTAMAFFKKMADGLNYEEIDNPYYKPSYFDRNINGLSFYHNMVFVQKGRNEEGSTQVVDNMIPSRHKFERNLKYGLRHMIAKLLVR
jgi:hypothetical protein